MSVTLPQPKFVKQLTNESCWAAALESWLDAVGPPSRKATQPQLLQEWNTRWPRPKPDFGAYLEEFRDLVADYAMNTKKIFGESFTAANLEGQLKAPPSAVVFIAYKVQAGAESWWHDVVLYGIVTPPGNEALFQVIDPAGGPSFFLRGDFFTVKNKKKEPVIIGWKSMNAKGKKY